MFRKPNHARLARRSLAILAFGLATLTATSVTDARAQDFNTNATIVYFDAAGNENLDPADAQAASSFSQEAMLALYDPLIRLTDAGDPAPGLAESWSVNDDLTTLTLKLRRNVTFHDGSAFDADVAKRNFERFIALGTRASGTVVEAVRGIASIDVLGPHEIRLTLKAPNGQMLYHLGGVAGMMASAASLTEGAYAATFKPLGAGPYKIKSFAANERTVFTRNDSYWGGTAGRPAGFEHHYVPDGRARMNALRSGQGNIALIEPRQIAEAKQAGFAVLINEKNSLWTTYLNLSRTQNVANLKVRQAMMYAVDRQALADALSYGSSKPTLQLFSSRSPAFDPNLEKLYSFDQDKARKLLAEAGFKDGVDITMLLLNIGEYRPIAEAYQAMLAEVGIKVKFDIVDGSMFPAFRRPPTRGDILLARWGGRPDPLQVFQELFGTNGSFNPSGVATPDIDVLIDKARRMTPDNPERVKLLHQIGRLGVEYAANIPLMTRSNVYAFRPNCMTGLTPYLPMGDDRFNDVKIGAKCK
jgi:ABC-type transport system substrate-binding protein